MISTENGPQKLTYGEFKARKQRRTIAHPVVTDDDAVVVYRAAEEALKKARASGNKQLIAQAEKDLADAEQDVRDATLVFRLRALPRRGENSYEVLKAEHPPTKDDNEKAADRSGDPKAKALFHPDSFGPALVAACLIEPEVTVEQAQEMAADWNDAEWDSLFSAAILVNQQATDTAGLVFS